MINIKHKILFHVRFQLCIPPRGRDKKDQKILANSIENTDVLFEHSDVKVDTSNAVFLFMSFLKKDVQRVMLLKEFSEP